MKLGFFKLFLGRTRKKRWRNIPDYIAIELP